MHLMHYSLQAMEASYLAYFAFLANDFVVLFSFHFKKTLGVLPSCYCFRSKEGNVLRGLPGVKVVDAKGDIQSNLAAEPIPAHGFCMEAQGAVQVSPLHQLRDEEH